MRPLIRCAGFALAIAVAAAAPARAQDPAWSDADTRTTLDRTLTIRLAPDLSSLTPAERTVVAKLLEAGAIMQTLYETLVQPNRFVIGTELVSVRGTMAAESAVKARRSASARLGDGPATLPAPGL